MLQNGEKLHHHYHEDLDQLSVLRPVNNQFHEKKINLNNLCGVLGNQPSILKYPIYSSG